MRCVEKLKDKQLDMNKSKCIIDENGNKHWYLNDELLLQLHREDGPASEYIGGEKHWYINGKRHREDGPAIEYANGSKRGFE